ncbi:uncharacterized protein LACBIDRAFT_308618 [Laccaria bicolor S238N-H82]|uniref:Predicted protein n=1 Tax=Laccaria bicolor (strain S238N-H82 / ATCC MYA-4686) TaxID=486041 RepID=B0CWT1_LACBS|nr:uncharacterized protein LACBIDRAFT_308618 [Laccaria bicolor S238N-H82]EDR13125.1 predicted protein [Laccaria bicolor S238N-H82]|eukprot:XP_001875623.1 predicted protein [Laccaria bicolor S238N-H82]
MSTQIQRHKTSNPYEAQFGYSRGIRRGSFIFISGTTSVSGEVGKALKEVFGDVGLAATMILGVRFVSEEMRVEIEADAVVL